MGSTLGVAQRKVKFGEFSEAYLVFADSRIHLHRSSEIEELVAVFQEVLDQHSLHVCSSKVSLESSVSFLCGTEWWRGHTSECVSSETASA